MLHLYDIYTTAAQRLRGWSNIVLKQMLCFDWKYTMLHLYNIYTTVDQRNVFNVGQKLYKIVSK